MLTIILVECSVEEMMDESFNFVPILFGVRKNVFMSRATRTLMIKVINPRFAYLTTGNKKGSFELAFFFLFQLVHFAAVSRPVSDLK